MFGPQTDIFSPQMRGWWQLSPMERSPGVLGHASGCGMSGHDARTRCEQDVLMGNPERTPGPAAGGWEILGEAMLGRTAPGHRAPGHRAPGRTAPGRTAPGHGAPGRTAPGRTALGSTMPGSSAPGRRALGHTAPGHGTAGICNPTGVCTTRVLQPSSVLHWELQHRDVQCQDVHQRDVQCWDTQRPGCRTPRCTAPSWGLFPTSPFPRKTSHREGAPCAEEERKSAH